MAVRKGIGRKAPAKTSSAQKREKKTSSIKDRSIKDRSIKDRSIKEKPKTKSSSWLVLFWLAFAIFIFGLFLFNREAISRSFQVVKNELSKDKEPREPVLAPSSPETEPSSPVSAPSSPAASPSSPPEGQAATQPASQPGSTPASPETSPPAVSGGPPPAVSGGPVQPAAGQRPAQTPPASGNSPAELRDRALYFIQVDRGGSIIRIKVDRKLPVSDSPLRDVIQTLIAGPNVDERSKGLISLIPPDTRILSVMVRGNTAYINFSEEFQYNTYGVEGYAGQIRQIVFTATEFPNVGDVQILVEGRLIEYLGEGVWIGSPLSREMF